MLETGLEASRVIQGRGVGAIQAVRALEHYGLCRFKKEDLDNRSMEADWKSIQAEEKRSARLGRGEDEKAEQEELERQRAKAAAKKIARKATTLTEI